MLTCDLTNPDLYDTMGRLILEHDLVHLRRMRFLWQAPATSGWRCATTAHAATPAARPVVRRRLSPTCSRSAARGASARPAPCRHGERQHRQRLAIPGLDRSDPPTVVSFATPPDKLSVDGALFDLVLQPGETRHIDLTIDCAADEDAQDQARPGFLRRCGGRGGRCAPRRRAPRQSTAPTPRSTRPYAARSPTSTCWSPTRRTVPIPTPASRGSARCSAATALITALQTLWLDPAIACGVLRHLARHQAEATDEAADAEPGKILHEMRQGEMALLGEVPFRHYYGSVDSTPLFVVLAGAYLERTDDLETVRHLWPNILAALRWMDESGDRDGDGFIEYGRQRDTGLINQGWKDSHDSIFHADGTLAHGPVALVEVPGLCLRRLAGRRADRRRLDDERAADGYAARARRLQLRFDDAFFDKALAPMCLPRRRQATVSGCVPPTPVTHCSSGIARPERAAAVVKTLTSNASSPAGACARSPLARRATTP